MLFADVVMDISENFLVWSGPKHLISGVMKPLLYKVPSTKVNEQALRFSFVLLEGSDRSSPL